MHEVPVAPYHARVHSEKRRLAGCFNKISPKIQVECVSTRLGDEEGKLEYLHLPPGECLMIGTIQYPL